MFVTAPDARFVRRYLLAGGLGIHLLAIILVSVRELLWLVANNLTIAPSSWREASGKLSEFAAAALGENRTNFYHNIVSTYLNLGDIEGGYGFFAPNVSDSYQLTFEFQFSDGHKEYDRPYVISEESALRMAGILDEIASSPLDPLRQALVKLLAQEATAFHPGAIALSATFSSTGALPSDTRTREAPAAKILFTYEFDLASQ